MFTNNNLAAKRNIAEESAKKHNSYSDWKCASKKASVPSETSGRGQEGNHSKVMGSGEGKKYIKALTSSSLSQRLLAQIDKGERIRCIDHLCSSTLTAASAYKWGNCHLDNIDALTKKEKGMKQSIQGTQNPRFLTGVENS